MVTVGHDWGGVISLGWALAHRGQLAGVVLTNTAVHQPPASPFPPALRLALHPAVHRLGHDDVGRLPARDARPGAPAAGSGRPRRASWPPTGRADRRAGVGNFVADIPADDSPSQLRGAEPRSPRASAAWTFRR